MLPTERLNFRRLAEADIPHVRRAADYDRLKGVRTLAQEDGPLDPQAFAEHVCLKPPDFKSWGFFNNMTGRFVGMVEIYPTPQALLWAGAHQATPSFGIWVTPPLHEQGFGKEAAWAAIAHTFHEQPDLEFMHGACYAYNSASLHLMQKSLRFHPVCKVTGTDGESVIFARHRNARFDYEHHFGPKRNSAPTVKAGEAYFPK